jgi:hypothetical protein
MGNRININVVGARTAKERGTAAAFWIVATFAMIAVGRWLESSAMQWLAFLFLFALAGGVAQSLVKAENKLTIAEARALLDKLEAREKGESQ